MSLAQFLQLTCAFTLALCLATTKRSKFQRSPKQLVLIVTLLAAASIALFKILDSPESDASEAAVWVAQVAFVVALISPRSRAESAIPGFRFQPHTLVLLVLCALVVTSQLDSTDSYQKKLIRMIGIVLPWAVARIFLWRSPLASPASAIALIAATLVYLFQFEKTPILAAGLLAVPLFFDRRVPVARRFMGLLVFALLFAMLWQIALKNSRYGGIGDYWSARVVKDGRDEQRLLGLFADGGRFSLWVESFELASRSIWTGMPFGEFRKLHEYDEHNAFVFFLARSGVMGFAIFSLLAFEWLTSMIRCKSESVARSIALAPTLLFALVGNYFCDLDYLTAATFACRLVPPSLEGLTTVVKPSTALGGSRRLTHRRRTVPDWGDRATRVRGYGEA
jgi:hypothetical protein